MEIKAWVSTSNGGYEATYRTKTTDVGTALEEFVRDRKDVLSPGATLFRIDKKSVGRWDRFGSITLI